MLDLFLQRLRGGLATTSYPTVLEPVPPTFRGMPRLKPERCRGEAACAAVCPSTAIQVVPNSERWTWTLDRAACLGCGRCLDVCPHGALEVESVFELAAQARASLRVATVVGPADSVDDASPARLKPLGDAVRARVSALFRRSLQLRHLDLGSCNGCDWELTALLNPFYDLQRFGIDLVASPRHADGLLVTGPVTRHLEPALWATYEAVPEPKMVIAIGACAAEAAFLNGSYAVASGIDRRLPVDVYIPGCPPRPEAILHGLLVALGRRDVVGGETNRPPGAAGPEGIPPGDDDPSASLSFETPDAG